MAEMVGSAVIQEAVSRVSSFVLGLGKHDDRESKGHEIQRLEMALVQLEFALERSAKLPITDVSLLSLASQFKLVTEFATEELRLLPDSLDTSGSYAPSLVGIQPQYIQYSDIFRPDPICCKAKEQGFCPSNIISTELSHILPEPVMYADFRCNISAQDCSLIRSIDDVDRPPLELLAAVVPHLVQEGLGESYANEVIGFKDQRRDGSIQEMTELVRSQVINRFVCQPQLTDYGMLWISAHGCACYGAQNINSVMASVPNADSRSMTRRVAKRRRRSCV